MFQGTSDTPGATGIDPHAIVDCGQDGALAHQAFVMGFGTVAFSGTKRMRDKLQAIAGQCGGTVVSATIPKGAIDLVNSANPEQDAQDGLAKRGGPANK